MQLLKVGLKFILNGRRVNIQHGWKKCTIGRFQDKMYGEYEFQCGTRLMDTREELLFHLLIRKKNNIWAQYNNGWIRAFHMMKLKKDSSRFLFHSMKKKIIQVLKFQKRNQQKENGFKRQILLTHGFHRGNGHLLHLDTQTQKISKNSILLLLWKQGG